MVIPWLFFFDRRGYFLITPSNQSRRLWTKEISEAVLPARLAGEGEQH